MNNYDLILAMQSLRENLISANFSNTKLREELRINNMIKLLELGVISKDLLTNELSSNDSYKNLTTIKAKIK